MPPSQQETLKGEVLEKNNDKCNTRQDEWAPFVHHTDKSQTNVSMIYNIKLIHH